MYIADQRVAAPEMQPEPGGLQPGDHRVQPQRDLGQFDRRRIQVHPIYLVKGDVRLHLLQLNLVLVGLDDLAAIFLLAFEVLGGEFADLS